MIPIQGNVRIDVVEVKAESYYHILQECSLDIPPSDKLVALIIDNNVL